MKRKLKILLSLLVCITIACSVSVAAFAVSPAYAFNVTNTGQNFVVDTDTVNVKVYANRGWWLNIGYINISNSPVWGMAFKPVRWDASNQWYYESGNVMWKKTTGSFSGSYGSGDAVAQNNYWISARIDDDYYGPVSASGAWNSDT